MSKLHFCVLLGMVALLGIHSTALGQEWARKMFRDSRHDFGTIARGTKAEYEFKFTNLYRDDVHVASVRSSCGCTTPFVKGGRDTLKSWETGTIVAHINSDTFLGNRGATVTVTIDRPQFAEVTLPVTVFIREDLVLQPGSVQFGAVAQGVAADRMIQVSSPGRGDLQILGVRSSHPSISARATETSRYQGMTVYRLDVHLAPDAPIGHLADHLILLTNLGANAQVPVAVEGIVEPSLVVSPDWLFFGVVPPGQRVVRQVVVRGASPFAISSITPQEAGFECRGNGLQEPKQMHMVSVAFTGGEPGSKLRQTLKIETDQPSRSVEFVAEAVTGELAKAPQPVETNTGGGEL